MFLFDFWGIRMRMMTMMKMMTIMKMWFFDKYFAKRNKYEKAKNGNDTVDKL